MAFMVLPRQIAEHELRDASAGRMCPSLSDALETGSVLLSETPFATLPVA